MQGTTHVLPQIRLEIILYIGKLLFLVSNDIQVETYLPTLKVLYNSEIATLILSIAVEYLLDEKCQDDYII